MVGVLGEVGEMVNVARGGTGLWLKHYNVAAFMARYVGSLFESGHAGGRGEGWGTLHASEPA